MTINNNRSTDQAISGLYTFSAAGSTDYLRQTMAKGIMVTGTARSNNPVTNFTVPHNSVSIWVSFRHGAALDSAVLTPRVANPAKR